MVTEKDVRAVVANAIEFLEAVREPHALLFLDIIHRRFGIEEFAGSLERYDEVLAERPEEAPVLRVFRRIADADNPMQPDELDHLTIQTERLIVSALY